MNCRRSDIVQQFFLARTAQLQATGWDDTLKNNDHYDAMLSMQSKGMRSVQRLGSLPLASVLFVST
jgi:hypothetical protein